MIDFLSVLVILSVIMEISCSPTWGRPTCFGSNVSFLIAVLLICALRSSCSRGGFIHLGRGSLTRCTSCCLWLNYLLCFCCLLFLKFFVLRGIYSLRAWTLSRATCHILSHHLLKRAIVWSTPVSTFTKSKEFLWLSVSLLLFVSSKFVNIRFGQLWWIARLPLDMVKHAEWLSRLRQSSCSVCSMNIKSVVNFQSLVEDTSQNVSSTSRPANLSRTWCFSYRDSNLFKIFYVPEVHLTFRNVTESSDHERVAERTDF